MSLSVLRSLSRVVAAALPEAEVRHSGDQEGAFERPYVGVLQATPVSSSAYGSRHAVLRASYAVVAYPSRGINADSSLLEAERVRRALWETLAAGIDAGPRRRPMRIPLWDYTGRPLFAAGPSERAGYGRVIGEPTFSAFADSEGAWTVTADLRLEWSEGIAAPETGALVETVGVRFG